VFLKSKIKLKPLSIKSLSIKSLSLKPSLDRLKTLKKRVVDKFHFKPLTVSKVNSEIGKEVIESFLKAIVIQNKIDDEKLFISLKQNKNVSLKRNEVEHLPEIERQITHFNSICTNSGECLIFGQESNGIKNLFNGFSDFRYLTDVKKVGERSHNGFVINLQYERMNYKVNALLKSSKNKRSDNLYYEYLVGTKFINRVNLFVPCFTETYRLLKHRTTFTREEIEDGNVELTDFSKFIDNNICDEKSIKNSLICIDKSCQNGENFAILLQYINEPISINLFVKRHEKDDLFESQMIAILFQIYAPLSYLKNEFTHYDLHTKNVILYKLPEGKFVEIRYYDETDDSLITIQTNYIAKIIDYGRCYFGNLGNPKHMTSMRLGELIKESSECIDRGIDTVGYNFFDYSPDKSNHYINSSIKNVSHDLRLVHLLSHSSRKMHLLFDGLIVYETNYGTPQKVSSSRDYIKNVTDVYDFLKVSIMNSSVLVSEDEESIGCIEVFLTKKLCRKEMKFTPIK
jgi:hypothetical protein